MYNLFQSCKRYVAGALMALFLLGPAGVGADGHILAQLATLEATIGEIENIISYSTDISVSQRLEYAQFIDAIRDEITLLTALETTGTTMEIVIASSTYAEAEVITSDGVRSLDFYFDAGVYDTTDPVSQAAMIDEIINRTAETYNLNDVTLASGVAVVDVFTGITVPDSLTAPEPESTPEPEPVLTPDSEVIGAAAGRTNVESISIRGSVPDYEILAQVVYGPEAGFERATVTKRYSFSRPSSASTMTAALQDLVRQGRERVSVEFGIDPGTVRAQGVVSIERYRNETEAREDACSLFVSDCFNELESVATYFGSYSVIEDVNIRVGDFDYPNRMFTVTFSSDQNEQLVFTVGTQEEECGRENTCREQLYEFSYLNHGVVTERETETGVTYRDFLNFLNEYFDGIGPEFGTDDDTFIPELASFLASNETMLDVNRRSYSSFLNEPISASQCLDVREEAILEELITLMLEGLQFDGTVAEITAVTHPVQIRYDDDGAFYARCTFDGPWFPSQP